VDPVQPQTEPTAPPVTRAPTVVDDPVVRPAPITTVPPSDGGSVSSPVLPAASPAAPPPVRREPVACAASEVLVVVVTEKATYAPGETVRGTSTLENRSTSTCLLPTRAFFRIENSAGTLVSSFAYTTEFRLPVAADPGKSFISSFTWDQQDCSGSACVQVPAGRYTAVAEWTESGPYAAQSSFQVGQ
jgi:hypothetical protein